MFNDDEVNYDEFEFEFELLNSDDSSIVTLVCSSSRPLSPDEYAQALRAYADRIKSILSMAELSNNTMN